MARICSGVVPQQPPSSHAPAWASSRCAWANASGPAGKTVRPPSMRGRPALGEHSRGRSVTRRIRRSSGSISGPPKPQFSPRAVTPKPSSSTAMVSTVPPVSSRPLTSAIMVARMGKSQASRAPSTAAFIS